MLRTNLIFMTLTAAASLLATPALAQDDTGIQTLEIDETPNKRVVKIVEAIHMWVDAEKLRVRDNPYAGDVVGMLELGQKVKVMDQTDNWIRISSEGKAPKWVNSDFLSKSRVTWSNYNFGSHSRNALKAPYDVDLKRIKIKDLKNMKVYAAHIKSIPNNGRLIITRHDFRSGPYYEKRVVHCEGQTASHVRMLGEGYNFSMMEQDPRNADFTAAVSVDHAIGEDTTILNAGIAEFTCGAKDI